LALIGAAFGADSAKERLLKEALDPKWLTFYSRVSLATSFHS
jgi:hypothetical protein